MDTLDEKHLALFGRVLTDAEIVNVKPIQQVFIAKMVEKLYHYVVKEAERDAREAQNK